MARLFIAAWPTDEIVERLREIPHPQEPGVRWVPETNWHITLRFLGDADIEETVRRLSSAPLPRSVAHLGPTVRGLGGRQLVVPALGVEALADAVLTATEGIGERDRHTFYGHITIARLARDARSSVDGTAFRSEFEIGEIALATSTLLPTGATYTRIATFATM